MEVFVVLIIYCSPIQLSLQDDDGNDRNSVVDEENDLLERELFLPDIDQEVFEEAIRNGMSDGTIDEGLSPERDSQNEENQGRIIYSDPEDEDDNQNTRSPR